MASRRLKSDRFLSKDYRPEVYTQAGHRVGRGDDDDRRAARGTSRRWSRR